MNEQAEEAKRAYRRVYAAEMTEEQKEAKRAYMRTWKRANQEKEKASAARYWEKIAQEAAAIADPADREAYRAALEKIIEERRAQK